MSIKDTIASQMNDVVSATDSIINDQMPAANIDPSDVMRQVSVSMTGASFTPTIGDNVAMPIVNDDTQYDFIDEELDAADGSYPMNTDSAIVDNTEPPEAEYATTSPASVVPPAPISVHTVIPIVAPITPIVADAPVAPVVEVAPEVVAEPVTEVADVAPVAEVASEVAPEVVADAPVVEVAPEVVAEPVTEVVDAPEVTEVVVDAPVAEVAPEVVVEVAPEVVAEPVTEVVVDAPVAEVVAEPVAEVADVAPVAPVVEVAPEVVAEPVAEVVVDAPVVEVAPEVVDNNTPDASTQSAPTGVTFDTTTPSVVAEPVIEAPVVTVVPEVPKPHHEVFFNQYIESIGGRKPEHAIKSFNNCIKSMLSANTHEAFDHVHSLFKEHKHTLSTNVVLQSVAILPANERAVVEIVSTIYHVMIHSPQTKVNLEMARSVIKNDEFINWCVRKLNN